MNTTVEISISMGRDSSFLECFFIIPPDRKKRAANSSLVESIRRSLVL
jgi:hypothetical protein